MTQEQGHKVWFITGSSRDFGRVWTEAALKRGDKVAATACRLFCFSDLNGKYGDNVLRLEPDITNSEQVKSFSKLFKQGTRLSPLEFRRQFN